MNARCRLGMIEALVMTRHEVSMITITPTASASYGQQGYPGQLVDTFARLDAKMTQADAQITDAVWQHQGVGADWGMWFDGLSHEILDARDRFAEMMPGHPLLNNFANDVVGLARRGGETAQMSAHNIPFVQGWQNYLDPAINDVRQAIAELTGR